MTETEADVRKYIERLVELGATEAVPIAPRAVVTAEWVRWKCQFGWRIRPPPDLPASLADASTNPRDARRVHFGHPGSTPKRPHGGGRA